MGIRASDIKVIGVFSLEKYVDELIEEDFWGQNAGLPTEKTEGNWIGNEILGFDCGSFRSYLCNGLDKDIMKKFDVHYNAYGLIIDDYEQVEVYAESIQGFGEPVTWIPVALYDFTT